MRKKLFLGALAVTALFSWAAKDPVLMKINGEDVKLSEFEYLYHKNNQQQLEKESLEQYVDRFVVYKLKVADAKNAGIDTTASFNREFNKYRDDLARPYMVDSATIYKLVDEAYDRKTREVHVAHIMLSFGEKPGDEVQAEARLDSIRTCILNGEDMGELAVKYSFDRSARANKGDLGFIVSGRYPYDFEKVAYSTPIGEISKPFRTDYGIHILKVLGERPTQGEALVEHILKLYPRDANDSIKNVKKQQMDSIYNAVMAGADFEELAEKLSDDKNSASVGGQLRWFSSGMMVPEFENVAFALKNNEVSKPFETAYGIHIVKKLNSRTIGTLEENKSAIITAINGDSRASLGREAKLEILKKEYKLKENNKTFQNLEKQLAATPYDSMFVENLKLNDAELFKFAKVSVKVNEIAGALNPKMQFKDAADAMSYIKMVTKNVENAKVEDYEKEQLKTKNSDYGNLLNEYYNGMMLYEISNRNVWDKANRDTEGLENFFDDNRAKYVWEKPKFKGTVIYTTNDSVEALVKEALKTIEKDSLVQSLKKQFKRDVRIEKILAEKGENAVVDALVYGGEKATPKVKRFNNYFLYEGKIIDKPEVATDVRGPVTSDYQNYLEEEWVKELKEKYPVVIDEKVLKTLK